MRSGSMSAKGIWLIAQMKFRLWERKKEVIIKLKYEVAIERSAESYRQLL